MIRCSNPPSVVYSLYDTVLFRDPSSSGFKFTEPQGTYLHHRVTACSLNPQHTLNFTQTITSVHINLMVPLLPDQSGLLPYWLLVATTLALLFYLASVLKALLGRCFQCPRPQYGFMLQILPFRPEDFRWS